MEEIQQPGGQVTLQNISVLGNGDIVATVDSMARDMRFYAILYIIYGGCISLTVFGAILGIPMIIYNLKLKDSANQYRKFIRNNDFSQLNKAFENQRKFFFFNKVLLIIGLVVIFLYVTLIIFFGLSLFTAASGDFTTRI